MHIASSWMTPELATFRDAVRRFVDAEVTPHQARWREQGHVDRAVWRKAGALHQLMNELPYERTIVGVAGVACIERALQLTLEHACTRKAFGQRLIDMQNTRFVLAECKTEATVARVFIDRCIDDLAAGRMDTVQASMAKYWITDLQCSIVDRCLQLFGGYGYMLEYPIARMYLDARVQRIYGGANEIMKEIIARSLETEAAGGG